MTDNMEWPDCAIDGCPRKCCLALDSVYCFPHTEGNEHVKRWKINARNAEPLGSPENVSQPLTPPQSIQSR